MYWQTSMRLATEIERLASRLPPREKYGLASQLRRAAASIPSNIAEGQPRPTRVYINHRQVALGSEAELKTELMLVASMNLIPESEIAPLLQPTKVGRMQRGLVRGLRAHLAKQTNRP